MSCRSSRLLAVLILALPAALDVLPAVAAPATAPASSPAPAPTTGPSPAQRDRARWAMFVPSGVSGQYDIEYARVGDKSLGLDIYRPAGATGKLPVIVWIHGGSWKSGNKNQIVPPVLLVPDGYAAVSIDYRLSTRDHATWPAQIDDCRAAIRFLRSHADQYGLDTTHIGVWGASAGGHLAALLATGTGDKVEPACAVQAVCDSFGPTDLTQAPLPAIRAAMEARGKHSSIEDLLGGTQEAKHTEAVQASPLLHVSAACPPFFIIHGDRDPLVPIDHSRRLCQALQKAGVEATMHVVAGGGHAGPEFLTPQVISLVRQFFDKHLKGQAAPAHAMAPALASQPAQ